MSRITAYAFSFPALTGGDIRLADYAGRPLLVVTRRPERDRAGDGRRQQQRTCIQLGNAPRIASTLPRGSPDDPDTVTSATTIPRSAWQRASTLAFS
jgi:hypothetical protein